MGPVIASVAIAVLAAAGVLVIAARMTSDRGEESFVAALRHGLRHDTSGPPMGVIASARREHAESAVADGSGMDDLFRAAATEQSAYLSADDLVRRRARTTG
ncbi:MAG: hypothetical protein KQH57_17880 [Actinomycetales bacterium]|nr:hypothetical protein [Actinomycetales bacterium]